MGDRRKKKKYEVTERRIRRYWRSLGMEDAWKTQHGEAAVLQDKDMTCLKDSYKSSIWKLTLQTGGKKKAVILKVHKPLRKSRPESTVEKNIYRRARKVLQPFMPHIYMSKRNVHDRGDLWTFMEYVEPVKGQIVYTPDHFARIIPSLARMHAATYGKRLVAYKAMFGDWMPRYDSKAMQEQREQTRRDTLHYLGEAMKRPALKIIVSPYERVLRRLLEKGPEYCPEVTKSGLCVVHGDLHTANMASHRVKEEDWQVRLIDWEGAKIAPCWYDIVNLIGVFLAYRREWKNEEDQITRAAVDLYAREMQKHGVVFEEAPLVLYRKAYLQRVLERGLYLQLNWAVTGKKEAKLLRVYLEKIWVLSKLLKL
ncbi:phosphotransferase [Paenibacillus daejeonensis]|uniref:phosphotransferase n=1 Tax=Paenibacillus daejeonensis TaxID=135193 RepID=UPI000372AA40|nr:phosphotransferase [Paenibacillus daejeonensis]